MIETTLNYLARMEERPYYFLYPPPDGASWRNTKGDRRTVGVRNARELEPAPNLDREGFSLLRHQTAAENLYDDGAVKETYYGEVEALVKKATGASRVLVFDHNVRNAAKAALAEDGVQNPVRFVHCDYTERSGPQRVRDLAPADEVETLLANRFAVVNVWKPICGPVEESPLAVCDAQSIRSQDVMETDLRYRDRTGEVYSFSFSPDHRWFYYPQMEADEVLLIKCFDSKPGVASCVAHTAIDDPTSLAEAQPRESIEVRTLAFYGS